MWPFRRKVRRCVLCGAVIPPPPWSDDDVAAMLAHPCPSGRGHISGDPQMIAAIRWEALR